MRYAMENAWLMSFLLAATIVDLAMAIWDASLFETNPRISLVVVAILGIATLTGLIYFLTYQFYKYVFVREDKKSFEKMIMTK